MALKPGIEPEALILTSVHRSLGNNFVPENCYLRKYAVSYGVTVINSMKSKSEVC